MRQLATHPGPPSGALCWPVLATPDVAEATRFYGELFDWESRPVPGTRNRVFTLRGHSVALAHALPHTERRAGSKAHWSVLVCVDDVPSAVIRAVALGGQAELRPDPVISDTQLVRVIDPGLSSILLQHAETFEIADRLHSTGALCEANLLTDEADLVTRFYTALFSWEILTCGDHVEAVHGSPVEVRIRQRTPYDDCSGWELSFGVADMSAVATLLQSPDRSRRPSVASIGPSSVLLSDPQGAALCVLDPTNGDRHTPPADRLLG